MVKALHEFSTYVFYVYLDVISKGSPLHIHIDAKHVPMNRRARPTELRHHGEDNLEKRCN